MIRRDFVLFLKSLPAALFVTVLLGFLCFFSALSLSHGTESAYEKASVAIVNDDPSLVSNFAVSLISAQDFASALKLRVTDSEKAEKGLYDGTYSAVLYLPENYAEEITTGQTASARLVVSENAALHADVLELLCRFGEELLCTGQYGVFSGEPMVLEIAPDRYRDYLDKTNDRFISQAISYTWFQRETIPYAGTGLSSLERYALLYYSSFMLLLLLSFFFVSKDSSTSMLRRLHSAGISDFGFLFSKFILIFSFELIITLGLLPAAHSFLSITPTGFFLPAMILTLFLTVSSGMMLLVCLPGSTAVTAVTILTALGLFTSGGIIPSMELPKAVTTLGDLLPTGIASSLMGKGLGGNCSVLSLLFAFFWILLSWILMLLHLVSIRKGDHRS